MSLAQDGRQGMDTLRRPEDVAADQERSAKLDEVVRASFRQYATAGKTDRACRLCPVTLGPTNVSGFCSTHHYWGVARPRRMVDKSANESNAKGTK